MSEIIFCKICNKQSYKGKKFCKSCGSSLLEANSLMQNKLCASCGFEARENAKFCKKCGEQFSVILNLENKYCNEYVTSENQDISSASQDKASIVTFDSLIVVAVPIIESRNIPESNEVELVEQPDNSKILEPINEDKHFSERIVSENLDIASTGLGKADAIISDSPIQAFVTPKDENITQFQCSKCKAFLKENAKFCVECGHVVESGVQDTIKNNQIETIEPVNAEDKNITQFQCPNCNTALKENTRFCTECGHIVATQETVNIDEMPKSEKIETSIMQPPIKEVCISNDERLPEVKIIEKDNNAPQAQEVVKPKNKLFFILLLVVVIVGTVAVCCYFVFFHDKPAKPTQEIENNKTATQSITEQNTSTPQVVVVEPKNPTNADKVPSEAKPSVTSTEQIKQTIDEQEEIKKILKTLDSEKASNQKKPVQQQVTKPSNSETQELDKQMQMLDKINQQLKGGN
ncbi:MAG: Double zinc ribbon [Pseudomonadota bacterium]|jgi:RNA polymerase subunit RPABC4/transcription elongation factor Spt4